MDEVPAVACQIAKLHSGIAAGFQLYEFPVHEAIMLRVFADSFVVGFLGWIIIVRQYEVRRREPIDIFVDIIEIGLVNAVPESVIEQKGLAPQVGFTVERLVDRP
jgi:hypothetical protein